MSTTIQLIKRSECIESNKASFSSAVVSKKFTSDTLEINFYYFGKDCLFFVDQAKFPGSLKTYTVISGSCLNLETEQILEAGDLFTVDHTQPVLNFKTLEDITLVVHAYNNSAYDHFVTNSDHITLLLTEIQNKDSYTKEHCNRVFELSQKLAIDCQLTSQALHNLILAARYHDVGKVFIDDEILNKPGALSAEEYEKMQAHVLKGKALITDNFSEAIFNIISLHHERIDGSGYPYGLKADEIPIEGRILAICDSYDAMITDRVYKKGKSVAEALDELRHLAGKTLDGELVHRFIKIIEETENPIEKE